MSPVEFKKRSCRPVEFKGQGPFYYKELVLGYLPRQFQRWENLSRITRVCAKV